MVRFGRYEILESLAVGERADVHLAHADGERVTLKVLRHEVDAAQFLDEVAGSTRFAHPRIARTLDSGAIDGKLYAAREYVEGIDVYTLLRELAVRRRRADSRFGAWLVAATLEALEYAHQLGAIHRDVSPENILIGGDGIVKLINFRATEIDRSHRPASAYRYLSPEQINGTTIDARSDVFSTGIVLAELLMGRPLFQAEGELDLLSMARDARLERFEKYGTDAPAPLVAATRRALHKQPDKRFASASEFRAAIRSWLEQESPVQTQQVGIVVSSVRDGLAPRKVESPPAPAPDPTPAMTLPRTKTKPAAVHIPPMKLTRDAASTGTPAHGVPITPPDAPAVARTTSFDIQPARRRPLTAEQLAAARPPTPPELRAIDGAPSESGDFAQESPLAVLFRLFSARATGVLACAAGGVRKEIYLRDGQPEAVSSNVASELFGNYLVAKNILSDGELAMALATMSHFNDKLGDTLVGLGLMKPLEVFRHLTQQVREKIIDVCTWTKGKYEWHPGKESPRKQFRPDMNRFELIGAGAMALTERTVDDWVLRHSKLTVRAVPSPSIAPERFEVQGLAACLGQFSGVRLENVWPRGDRATRVRTVRMLILLVATGLATLS